MLFRALIAGNTEHAGLDFLPNAQPTSLPGHFRPFDRRRVSGINPAGKLAYAAYMRGAQTELAGRFAYLRRRV